MVAPIAAQLLQIFHPRAMMLMRLRSRFVCELMPRRESSRPSSTFPDLMEPSVGEGKGQLLCVVALGMGSSGTNCSPAGGRRLRPTSSRGRNHSS